MQGHEAPAGYAITRRLGSDASAMYLATELATGRPVTLRFAAEAGPAVRERLRASVPVLRAVNHPHVVPFFDVVEGPSGVVVVFASAEGGSLAGIIGARGIVPPGEVVTACAPVAEGLTDVHRMGLIHGDLTLDDIVFTLDGKPMIVGVGLVQAGVAMRVGQHARPMPPEVRAGSPPGPAADVYGLVTAAVIALTGYLPPARLPVAGMSPAAEALLASALDANPHRRPNAASVGNAFFAIADPTPVELVLEDGHATTGSLPAVAAAEPDDDIAAYMGRSTSVGRRARRRSDDDAAAEQPAARERKPDPPRTPENRRRGRRTPPPIDDDVDLDSGRKRRRIDGVWIVSALVALLLAAGAVIVGLQLFGDDAPQAGPGTGSSPSDSEASTDLCGGPQPAPTTAPPPVSDWTQEVQRLYSLRAQAFEESEAELLCQVHAPTNPILAEDATLLQEYVDAGVHTEGLTFEVVNAEVVAEDGGRVTLSITQRIPDYQLVDDDGEVAQEIDGTEEETWQAELVAVADEGGEATSWRFG